MRNILFVLGTRPEAIKLCPLIRHFRENLKETRTLVCSTGQHRHMLDQVLDFFQVRPDYELGVMEPGQTLFALSARLIGEIEAVCAAARPDYMVVQGDTTSAFMGALAGYYCGARVLHVEAGLRTGDLKQPFPEEGNRVLTSHLAWLHFAPTELARVNLEKEGIRANVHVVGNTVIDALLWALPRARLGPGLEAMVREALEQQQKIVLVTGHRRESFGKPFEEICMAIRDVAQRNDVLFMYPVHLNPNVREPVERILGGVARVKLFAPVDYPSMVALMKACHLVLTDSGGVQEEAPSIGKPVLVMRNATERPEGVQAGTSMLVGVDRSRIVRELNNLLDNKDEYSRMSEARNPYGDGHASELILQALQEVDHELR